MTRTKTSVTTAPGIRHLLLLVFFCLSGFALLLPVSPQWAVHGGADEFGAGLVTATLMATTVLAQLLVKTALRRLGWPRTLALGTLLLGLPAPVQAFSDSLWAILLTTALRGSASASSPCAAPPPQRCSLPRTPRSGHRPVRPGPRPAPDGADPGRPGPGRDTHPPGDHRLRCTARPRPAVHPRPRARGRRPHHDALTGAGSRSRPYDHGAPPHPAAPGHPAVGDISRRCGPDLHSPVRRPSGSGRDGAVPLHRHRRGCPLGLRSPGGPLRTPPVDLHPPDHRLRRPGPHRRRRPLRPTPLAGLPAGLVLLGAAYGGVQSITLVQALADAGAENRQTTSVAWNIGYDSGTGLGSLLLGLAAQVATFSTGFTALSAAMALAAAVVVTAGNRPRNKPTASTTDPADSADRDTHQSLSGQ